MLTWKVWVVSESGLKLRANVAPVPVLVVQTTDAAALVGSTAYRPGSMTVTPGMAPAASTGSTTSRAAGADGAHLELRRGAVAAGDGEDVVDLVAAAARDDARRAHQRQGPVGAGVRQGALRDGRRRVVVEDGVDQPAVGPRQAGQHQRD